MDRPEGEITLGSFLRTERERRGITPEQVAAATKIAIKYLHALEADDFSELPATPFVRGFVNSYARFVGLDGVTTLRQYERFIEKKGAERPNREGGHSGYAFEPKDSDQRSRLILSVVMGVMVVAGGIVLAFRPNLRGRKHGHLEKLRASPAPESSPLASADAGASANPSPSASVAQASPPTPSATVPSASPSRPAVVAVASPVPAIPPPVASATPGPSPSPSASAAAADPLDSGKDYKLPDVKHKLTIKAIADIWVRYRVDDKPLRKFVMRKGAVLILRSKEKVVFQISNPRAATLSYNGTGARRVEETLGMKQIQETYTLAYPRQAADSLMETFQSEKPLPQTADPAPGNTEAPKTPSSASSASESSELSTGNP